MLIFVCICVFCFCNFGVNVLLKFFVLNSGWILMLELLGIGFG